MKTILTISFFFLYFNSFAQSQYESRILTDFSKLKTSGSFDIKLLQSDRNEVLIYGDPEITKKIISIIEGGKLILKPEKGFKKYTTIKIILRFKTLEDINLFGSGDFTSGTLKMDELKFSARGSGDQNLNVECKKLDIDMSGSGDLKLTGSTISLGIKSFGSGNIHGFEMNTETIVIESKGSGDIDINASKTINGEAFGSGDIECKGGALVDIIKQGSGTISVR